MFAGNTYLPFIDQVTRDRYETAGFGRLSGLGERPALLIIDVQYRTTGSSPMPYEDAVKEYVTSCGDRAWGAVQNIARLLELFRDKGWPVIYPHVAPKESYDRGALRAKVPRLMDVPQEGYKFVEEIAPVEGDILVPKRHPSAFFGTPLASYIVESGADSLVVTGCSTSGCVRASVVDAFSLNYKVAIPHDAVYDRSDLVHQVNLFDMDQKYGDVHSTEDLILALGDLAGLPY